MFESRHRVIVASLFLASCASTPLESEREDVQKLTRNHYRVGLVILESPSHAGQVFDATEKVGPPTPPAAAPASAPAAASKSEPLPVTSAKVIGDHGLALAAIENELKSLEPFVDIVPLKLSDRLDPEVVWTQTDKTWYSRISQAAEAQEVDMVLLVKGYRDGGVGCTHEENLASWGTVWWWLLWPFGVGIADRHYESEVRLLADVLRFRQPLKGTEARPDRLTQVWPVGQESGGSTASDLTLSPWGRSSMAWLGFIAPPAWVPHTDDVVHDRVQQWTEKGLPVALARDLKKMDLTHLIEFKAQRTSADVEIDMATRGCEVSDIVAMGVPRGANVEPDPKKLTIPRARLREGTTDTMEDGMTRRTRWQLRVPIEELTAAGIVPGPDRLVRIKVRVTLLQEVEGTREAWASATFDLARTEVVAAR